LISACAHTEMHSSSIPLMGRQPNSRVGQSGTPALSVHESDMAIGFVANERRNAVCIGGGGARLDGGYECALVVALCGAEPVDILGSFKARR
jgi:hypothetical protein